MDEKIVLYGVLFLIKLIAAVWAYKDAEKYNQSGWLVGALIFFAGISGILVWLLIRDNLPKRM